MPSRIPTSTVAVLALVACLVWPLHARAQMPADEDDAQHIERLEEQVRRLTGQNEELQHRNQLLEEQLRQLQAGQAAVAPVPGVPPRGPQPPVVATNPPPQAQQPQYQPQPQYQQPAQQPQYQQQPYPAQAATPPAPGGRRGDAFDPSQNPSAPGAPRQLGSTVAPVDPNATTGPQVGAPGGRGAGEPLDLANTSPQRPGAPGGALTTQPPAATPRDEYDLGVGYIERKDYALAEETMRNFVRKYPSDHLVADAQYWLGEAMFQRQHYREAAEAFLNVSTKYESSARAPEALLRLGQSLAALKEKEAACAALGEVTRKYPRAGVNVKQGVEREQKRVKC